MTIQNFEDLEIWKAARGLTQTIYKLTKTEKFSKDFALRDQLWRAAVSIMSNIAKDLSVEETRNLVNSCTLRKVHAVRCVHNFT